MGRTGQAQPRRDQAARRLPVPAAAAPQARREASGSPPKFPQRMFPAGALRRGVDRPGLSSESPGNLLQAGPRRRVSRGGGRKQHNGSQGLLTPVQLRPRICDAVPQEASIPGDASMPQSWRDAWTVCTAHDAQFHLNPDDRPSSGASPCPVSLRGSSTSHPRLPAGLLSSRTSRFRIRTLPQRRPHPRHEEVSRSPTGPVAPWRRSEMSTSPGAEPRFRPPRSPASTPNDCWRGGVPRQGPMGSCIGPSISHQMPDLGWTASRRPGTARSDIHARGIKTARPPHDGGC